MIIEVRKHDGVFFSGDAEEFMEVMKNDMIDSDHRSGYYEGCDYVIEFWR